MALKKLITDSNGNESNYHKIVSPNVSQLKFISYKDETFRKDNPSDPVHKARVFEIELNEEERNDFYSFLYNLAKNKIPEFLDSEDC